MKGHKFADYICDKEMESILVKIEKGELQYKYACLCGAMTGMLGIILNEVQYEVPELYERLLRYHIAKYEEKNPAV